MTSRFDGLYFDGVRSSPRPVSVFMQPDGLILQISREDARTEDILISGGVLKRSEYTLHGEDEISTLRFGVSGLSSLEIRGQNFRSALQTLPDTCRPKGTSEGRISPGFAAALAAGMAGLLLLLWFVVIPEAGDFLGRNLPREWENVLSRGLEDLLVREYPVDDGKTAALYDFSAAAGLPGLENLRLYVVESAETNAYAVMGNAIFINKPMLALLESPDELAALLFHEYAHIKLRHTSRTTMRTLASYYLLSMVIGDSSGVLAALLQNADTLQQLKYSRDFESEADAEAVRMLAERGLDVMAMPSLLVRLEQALKDYPRGPELLSTHPDEKERINRSRALAMGHGLRGTAVTAPAADLREAWDRLTLRRQ